MTLIAYIARPLVGAVIGYITNDIAIRMLFRPRTTKYIFGWRIPFTPGLIPKEKSRIAASIGAAISENLMNKEVLEKTLLSEEITAKISGSIQNFANVQKHNSQTVEEYLSQYISAKDIHAICDSVTTDLSMHIHTVLSSANFGSRIAGIVVEHVVDKVKQGTFGMFGADKFIGLLVVPVQSLLEKNINEMLANNSQTIFETMIEDQIAHFLSVPMKNLFENREELIDRIEQIALNMYQTLVTEQLPKILDALNISKIIETRINEMDVKESEELILEVMNRELKAIVWLGALLGFAMGCINLLF